jgi:putative endonuclease
VAARRARWCVYVLRCGDGTLYTGATCDLARRVEAHARGRGGRYTRSRLPVLLVHAEQARDHGAALRREAALKRLPRAEKLALVAAGTADARRPGRPSRVVARAGRPPARDARPVGAGRP